MSLERLAKVHVELPTGRKVAHITAAVAALSAIAGIAINFSEMLGVYFWIAVGSALGGVSRYWASGVAARLIGETFPWGTLIINVLGSFIIGFFATLTGPDGRVYVHAIARQFVMIGFCGGFTTFSSFSLQTLNLMNDGEWLRAGGNIGASVMCCLIAVWAGHMVVTGLNTIKWI